MNEQLLQMLTRSYVTPTLTWSGIRGPEQTFELIQVFGQKLHAPS